MDKEASQALEIAHRHVDGITSIVRDTDNDTVHAIGELSKVVYQVGYAIVHQIAVGPDK